MGLIPKKTFQWRVKDSLYAEVLECFSKVLQNRLFFSLQLQCVEGNILVASGENKMEVPLLKPDEQGELAVHFIAPATPGHYERCVIKISFYVRRHSKGNTIRSCYCQL